jgi:hypothetical protein
VSSPQGVESEHGKVETGFLAAGQVLGFLPRDGDLHRVQTLRTLTGALRSDVRHGDIEREGAASPRCEKDVRGPLVRLLQEEAGFERDARHRLAALQGNALR